MEASGYKRDNFFHVGKQFQLYCGVREKRKPQKQVLCPDGTYNYKEAFKYFAKSKMNVDVQWDTDWKQSGKYILLCDVVSRIPRDVTHVIKSLGLNVDRLRENTMVVAMHISEGGQHDDVSDFIGSAEDPLHSLQMRNVYYSGNLATKCSENDRAKQDIKSFLA